MGPGLQRLFDALVAHGCRYKPSGPGYLFCCPGHDDQHESLSVDDGVDRALVFCQAGCETDYLLGIVSLTFEDLYNEPRAKGSSKNSKKKNRKDTDPRSSKRLYTSLADYAEFKGAAPEAFTSLGWKDTTHNGRTALEIPTATGPRFRFLDNAHPKFIHFPGYNRCWYQLARAVELALEAKLPLVYTNGEPSVAVAQWLGVAATCVTSGEKKNIPSSLFKEFMSVYPPDAGAILIALDYDNAGRTAARGLENQFREAGYDVRAVDLQGEFEGYDLADFLKAHGRDAYQRLVELPNLTPSDEQKELEFAQEAKELSKNQAGQFDLTDTGNAHRLVRDHDSDLRYCKPFKRWYHWTGVRWAADDTGEVDRRAEDTARRIYIEAAETRDPDRAAKIGQHARASRSDRAIKSMIRRAESQPGIPILPEQFDTDPWVLNCQNGALDLRTGKLRLHSRADMQAKIVNTSYDPNAQPTEWLGFLNKIMDGNENLISFLQRAIGYSLTGNTMEKCIFFLYGHLGNNGKSTFLETLSALLGSYSLPKFPISALLEDKYGNASGNSNPNVAQLAGVRFVSSSEVGAGKKLNEELVKDLAGGIDTISAKRLYENPFTFKPSHKLFIYGNNKPQVSNDNAIWNRIRMIPFEVSIPEDQQDKKLPEKLAAQFPGILTWAVAGCLAWQEQGLGIPDEVSRATFSYRQEMDVVGRFIAENCEVKHGAINYHVAAKDIYMAFENWCGETGDTLIIQKEFGRQLTDRGFERYRGGHNGGHRWRGIRLKTTEELAEKNSNLTSDLTHLTHPDVVSEKSHWENRKTSTITGTGQNGSDGSVKGNGKILLEKDQRTYSSIDNIDLSKYDDMYRNLKGN